jgi:hypothetical protein
MSEGSPQISAAYRGGYSRHVEKLEKGVWDREGLMEARIQQVIIYLEDMDDVTLKIPTQILTLKMIQAVNNSRVYKM